MTRPRARCVVVAAGALGFASALSLPYLLDEAEGELAAAVDGDPSTPVSRPD